MERHNLYVFRCDKRLTQAEMAELLGISRITYANIERGKRSGDHAVWRTLQEVFNVPDAEMYSLMKLEDVSKGEE